MYTAIWHQLFITRRFFTRVIIDLALTIDKKVNGNNPPACCYTFGRELSWALISSLKPYNSTAYALQSSRLISTAYKLGSPLFIDELFYKQMAFWWSDRWLHCMDVYKILVLLFSVKSLRKFTCIDNTHAWTSKEKSTMDKQSKRDLA